MIKLTYGAAIAILLFSSIAFATPGIPNRFYGTVSSINGPVPDGTVIDAKMDSITIASTTTLGGKYGWSPNVFDVTDPDNNRDGKVITFFVNGESTGITAVFTNGKVSELNLIVSDYANKNQKTNRSTTNPSFGSAAPNILNAPCISNWYCSDWSSCSADVRTRRCVDVNYCTTPSSTPLLIQSCTKSTVSEGENASLILKAIGTTKADLERLDTPTGRLSTATLSNIGIVAAILLLATIILYARKKQLM